MEPVTKNLPVIAMRGLNVFPRMNTSFDLERPISVHALERAMENGEEIFLVTQREIGVEQPEEKDLYEIGTVARVTQILRVSDRVLRVMMEGACRARLKRLWQREPFLQAQVELIDEPATSRHSKRTEAMLRQTYASVTEYAELAQKLPDDVYAAILSTNDPGYLADFIAQQLNLRYQDKQDILDELRPLPRLQRMNEILRREIEVTAMEQDIESKVRSRVGKIQKDFVLREQIKVLQNEIGEGGEDEELDEYREKISKAHLSEEVERKLLKDVDKLAKQPFGSAEASVLRNYLDTCMEMPWGEETKERASVDAARKVLDRDHYGLQKVKERILEFIAVRQLNPEAKGSGLGSRFESQRHFYRIACYGDSCVHQCGGCSQFHCFGGMTGRTDAGIYHNRDACLFDNNLQEFFSLQSFVGTDGGTKRHYSSCAGFFQPFAEYGVGLTVGQYYKSQFDKLFGSF